MKRFLHIMILAVACCCFQNVKAQNSFNLPNPSFENWSQGQGYSVSVTVFSWPVYYDYTYPTDWQFPVYPFQESLSYNGLSLNIDTDIPLIKLSESTTDVPQGDKALKMQSFMLSDILGYAILNIAYGTLDSELVHSIYPSIIATGNINLDQFFPVFGNLMGDIEDSIAIFQALSNLDINNYITGGLALDGFQPSRLTGSYKYTSATAGGDNGGILMLGTHYNSSTHRREVVGGGFTAALTDVNNYTPFSVAYHSLSELTGSGTSMDADSLIILLISSCNDHRLQGSVLYLDDLNLIHEDIIEPEPCEDPTDLTVSSLLATSATISWADNDDVDTWEYSYGLKDYTLDPTTASAVTTNSITIDNLSGNTEYDVYVRANCNTTQYSDWTKISFTTLSGDAVTDHDTSNWNIFPNPANGSCTISFSAQSPASIQLYSSDGKIIQTLEFNEGNINMNLPYSGIFFLRIQQNGTILTQKIINL